MILFGKSREQSANAQLPPKVLVLGIDGMDPDLLETYLAQGSLPNFARLRERGVANAKQ